MGHCSNRVINQIASKFLYLEILFVQARNIMLHEDEAGDAITGLQQKTHYGRPQWDQIFESISAKHAKYVTVLRAILYTELHDYVKH